MPGKINLKNTGLIVKVRITCLFFCCSIIAANDVSACRINTPSNQRILDYNQYNASLIVTENLKSGKKLPAYEGISLSSIEDCIRACEAENHCSSITWRPKKSNNCLKYTNLDFVTGDKVRIVIHSGWNNHQSVHIRSSFSGRLCKHAN